MKISLRILLVVLAIIALVAGGAVIGALFSGAIVNFAITTVAAIAALVLLFIGYNGHHKEKNEEKKGQK